AEITGESGNYTVEISDNSTFTTPITSTTTDLYYKVATPLKYNTFYFWRVKRGASTSTTNSFTTKPLNLISESYKVSGSPITPYTSIAFSDVIDYTAITDEFENLNGQNANVNFTYSSTFVNSTPVVNQLLEYGTPDANYHSAISTNITAKQWDGTLSAFPIIDITDNETLSLKFQYGSEMKLTTPTSTYVPIQSIATYTDGGYLTISTAYHFDNAIYLSFTPTTVLDTNNNSIKVIIKNKNNNSQLIRYAIKSGENYRLALTKDDINSITSAGLADRISIYPANQTDKTRDFIWLGNTPGTVAAAATASPTNIQFNGSFTVSVQTPGLVRVVSTIDSVGFVLSLPLNGTASITSGSATDVQGKIIEAAIATNSISIVKPDGAAYTTPQNVTVDSYQLIAFNMIAPSNFTQDADIYPKFEWSAAKGGRGIEDNFFYRVTIATDPSLSTIVETGITQNTFYYPQTDLKFGKTYYWKVVAVQGGVETPPANIGTMQAWNFITISSDANYYISSIIPANRTLIANNSPYKFINSPGTAANTTLTIEAGVELKFAVNTSLAIGGDIIAKGTSSDLITFTTDAASWKGIEFNTAAGITRVPLLVNEDGSYLSGSLLEYVIIEKALTPIQSVGAGKVDIYFDHVTFTGNETGIDLGLDSKSYFKDVTFDNFVENATPNKFVVKGGHSFDNVIINGTIDEGKFLGSAIQTSDKNLIVKNSTITNLTGNGIESTATALDGAAYIYSNTIQNIGTANTNYAIKAAAGASVVGNTIGGSGTGVQNYATSILRCKYIADNTIVQNRGLGAIEADVNDAVV
ncbi:MAG TPA: hypothetical protein PLV22_06590, partial [Candidatus Cloacimonadota bacterium]|nr:hypothetical protein [Candidatus Cloacimonadota bacterium]